MFAPPAKPGPKSAPAKDRARARVVELRRQGLSVYEISSRLRAEATPQPPDGTPTCPGPRSSTSPRSPPAPTPAWPGCC